jgi:ABC-type multidrug transport system permease subunit
MLTKEKENLINQKDANFIFQGLLYNPAYGYGLIGKIALVGAFFSYAVPLAPLFAIITLVLLYWSKKYSLLRLKARPPK